VATHQPKASSKMAITLAIQITYRANHKQTYLKASSLNIWEQIVRCSIIRIRHRNRLIKYSIKNKLPSKQVISWLIIQIRLAISIPDKILPNQEETLSANKI